MNALRRIVITGPESSGKSTLATALSEHFGAPLTPEYARSYLEQLGRPYEEKDLLHIARKQVEWEEEYASRAENFLFCDTALIVLKIWSIYKYGRCHSYILDALQTRTYDLYLLCHPDLPWIFDPLRENPNNREELLHLYQIELQKSGANYIEITGHGPERTQKALAALFDQFPH